MVAASKVELKGEGAGGRIHRETIIIEYRLGRRRVTKKNKGTLLMGAELDSPLAASTLVGGPRAALLKALPQKSYIE